MAAKDDQAGAENLLDVMLERAREQYIEENGEEPPEGFMINARELILRNLASHGRAAHRDVYDALADE